MENARKLIPKGFIEASIYNEDGICIVHATKNNIVFRVFTDDNSNFINITITIGDTIIQYIKDDRTQKLTIGEYHDMVDKLVRQALTYNNTMNEFIKNISGQVWHPYEFNLSSEQKRIFNSVSFYGSYCEAQKQFSDWALNWLGKEDSEEGIELHKELLLLMMDIGSGGGFDEFTYQSKDYSFELEESKIKEQDEGDQDV